LRTGLVPFGATINEAPQRGLVKLDESGGCVALATCCVSCSCLSRCDCLLGRARRVSTRLGDVRPILTARLCALFSLVFALGGVFVVDGC
jgi:hypothetical protein